MKAERGLQTVSALPLMIARKRNYHAGEGEEGYALIGLRGPDSV